ncbi:hypothetical protein [Streptomyces hydrogenans]|uniref:hypothetical protein n=1 Tax=Streptomyces hydrogenans TaxID=1873719 RepID=UPI0034486EEF
MIHCEVWAGTQAAPHTWLLRRQEATDPETAVWHLRTAARWLADRLADAGHVQERLAAALRDWTEDVPVLQDLQDQIARGKFVSEAARFPGGDGAFYLLTAMPSAGCPCRPPAAPGLLDLRGSRLVRTGRILVSGGLS